jgi:hypothetical protein
MFFNIEFYFIKYLAKIIYEAITTFIILFNYLIRVKGCLSTGDYIFFTIPFSASTSIFSPSFNTFEAIRVLIIHGFFNSLDVIAA